jgi:hypothetical protein
MEVSGQPLDPAAFIPVERVPITHFIGGYVGLRIGLDDGGEDEIFNFALSNSNLSTAQARRQSLYLLRYTASS